MLTVRDMWLEYSRVVGVPFGGVQWRETERAFYAGVLSFLAEATVSSGSTPEQVKAASGWLAFVHKECRQFFDEVLASEAKARETLT